MNKLTEQRIEQVMAEIREAYASSRFQCNKFNVRLWHDNETRWLCIETDTRVTARMISRLLSKNGLPEPNVPMTFAEPIIVDTGNSIILLYKICFHGINNKLIRAFVDVLHKKYKGVSINSMDIDFIFSIHEVLHHNSKHLLTNYTSVIFKTFEALCDRSSEYIHEVQNHDGGGTIYFGKIR